MLSPETLRLIQRACLCACLCALLSHGLNHVGVCVCARMPMRVHVCVCVCPQLKEKARDTLARRYCNAHLSQEQLLSAIYAFSDNNSYLLFNRYVHTHTHTHTHSDTARSPLGVRHAVCKSFLGCV